MKFRLEPALWLAAVSAALSLAVTLGFPHLTAEQAALIVAAITAIVGAIKALYVRPIAPAVFTTLVTAVAALTAGYGFMVSSQTVGAIQALVVTVLALILRNQVTPVSVVRAQDRAVAAMVATRAAVQESTTARDSGGRIYRS